MSEIDIALDALRYGLEVVENWASYHILLAP